MSTRPELIVEGARDNDEGFVEPEAEGDELLAIRWSNALSAIALRL